MSKRTERVEMKNFCKESRNEPCEYNDFLIVKERIRHFSLKHVDIEDEGEEDEKRFIETIGEYQSIPEAMIAIIENWHFDTLEEYVVFLDLSNDKGAFMAYIGDFLTEEQVNEANKC